MRDLTMLKRGTSLLYTRYSLLKPSHIIDSPDLLARKRRKRKQEKKQQQRYCITCGSHLCEGMHSKELCEIWQVRQKPKYREV